MEFVCSTVRFQCSKNGTVTPHSETPENTDTLDDFYMMQVG